MDFCVLFCCDLFHGCVSLDFYVIIDRHLSTDPSKTQAKSSVNEPWIALISEFSAPSVQIEKSARQPTSFFQS